MYIYIIFLSAFLSIFISQKEKGLAKIFSIYSACMIEPWPRNTPHIYSMYCTVCTVCNVEYLGMTPTHHETYRHLYYIRTTRPCKKLDRWSICPSFKVGQILNSSSPFSLMQTTESQCRDQLLVDWGKEVRLGLCSLFVLAVRLKSVLCFVWIWFDWCITFVSHRRLVIHLARLPLPLRNLLCLSLKSCPPELPV